MLDTSHFPCALDESEEESEEEEEDAKEQIYYCSAAMKRDLGEGRKKARHVRDARRGGRESSAAPRSPSGK